MEREAFLARVGEYHRNGLRLALINVTTLVAAAAPAHGAKPAAQAAEPAAPEDAPAPNSFEVIWVFEKDSDATLETIREIVTAGDVVPSISAFFGAAFLYENEMRELFGINVEGINVDLQGQLFKTNTKVPFSHAAVKARLEATAAAAAAKSEAAAAARTTEPKA
jgi:ech hydrogenase subunit D